MELISQLAPKRGNLFLLPAFALLALLKTSSFHLLAGVLTYFKSDCSQGFEEKYHDVLLLLLSGPFLCGASMHSGVRTLWHK